MKRVLAIIGFPLLLVATAPGQQPVPGLSGDYDDEGTVVAAAGTSEQTPVSLHALLALEFEPRLARMLHAQTSLVRVQHARGRLKVEVLDTDGNVGKLGRWSVDRGGADKKDSATLRFRASPMEDLVYVLESVGDGRLLQVTVHRESATAFGPVVTPAGTYLFPRIK